MAHWVRLQVQQSNIVLTISKSRFTSMRADIVVYDHFTNVATIMELMRAPALVVPRRAFEACLQSACADLSLASLINDLSMLRAKRRKHSQQRAGRGVLVLVCLCACACWVSMRAEPSLEREPCL